jgi:pimeloyl-ACP methyl ester carboxylesterase
VNDHFIWCGVTNGSGQLNLTFADAGGNVLAQTTAYIQLQDIKQMYERWTVGDEPSIAPKTNAVPAVEGLPVGASAFLYTVPSNTNTPYILFVHGWNMETWNKDRWAETAFKRLYWQGYQGRFGSFRWPTGNGFTGSYWQTLTDPRNFDNSEFIAWQSAAGLLNKLNNLNAEYPSHVYMLAHSMGNIVAGEALRKAAQQGLGQLVNTYVASQAAVPGHCYDSTLTGNDLLDFGTLYGPDTPNIYNNWMATNGAAAGARINFYNTNDYALASGVWQLDQISKPDIRDQVYYYASSDLSTVQDLFKKSTYDNVVDAELIIKTHTGIFPTTLHLGDANTVQDRYEIMAFDSEPRSLAMGATPDVHTMPDVDLTRTTNPRIWPPDTNPNFLNKPYGEHFWHSAEFRGDNAQMQGYWSELLSSEAFNLK